MSPKIKSWITGGLLLFVAASVAIPIARRAASARREASAKPEMAGVAPPQPEVLVVYYFRSNVRCVACSTLEACSRDVVENRFPAEVVSGRVQWRAIDYQSPGNEHWSADYQLLTGGVVLAEFHDGLRRQWKALPETWNMTGDRTVLANYLEASIRAFLAAMEKDQAP
jgi:hypothetical protein